MKIGDRIPEDNLAWPHSVRRTSPMGEAFVGTCWECGEENIRDIFDSVCEITKAKDVEKLMLGIEGKDL